MWYSASMLLLAAASTAHIAKTSNMSTRTVLNEPYRGLVESFSIPAELHERDGKKFATFGSAIPIHSCTPEEVEAKANATHHYCDIFTEQVLAPLGELAFVRLDENTAEKVFINRAKRMLVVSSDGTLAQWRCAPTFESANSYVAGTPLVNREGALVSIVTARRGNNYAVSTFEGEGGYFETSKHWKVVDSPDGASIYGDSWFPSREELREHISALPGPGQCEGEGAGAIEANVPVLHRGHSPRIVLVAPGGRQVAHIYLHNVINDNVEYL